MEIHLIPHSKPEPGAVLTKALVRAGDLLGLTGIELAKTVGLSPAHVSKLRNGQKVLNVNSVQFDLARLVVRIFRSLDAIVAGSGVVAQQWMRNQNTALNGRPIDLIQSTQGLAHVLAYLDANRAKI